MSIETEIQKLTAAILELSFAYREGGNPKGASAEQVAGRTNREGPTEEIVSETPTPVAGMPDLPDFTKPPVETPILVPFTDMKGLTAYTIETYTALGAEKGAGVQAVLQELGYSNINEVQPDKYATYFEKVEALKTA